LKIKGISSKAALRVGKREAAHEARNVEGRSRSDQKVSRIRDVVGMEGFERRFDGIVEEVLKASFLQVGPDVSPVKSHNQKG
jgi:hypothetical protein